MCSGYSLVMALRGKNAVRRWRALMGAVDPGEAATDSLRAAVGQSVLRNGLHGASCAGEATESIIGSLIGAGEAATSLAADVTMNSVL